ncbi:hypothetical protein AB0M32_42630 [Streptomyces sp. NPDC051985]|uniref:hypothetical protein n=1 Tax=Streptomyces sp. NPDC051985 TaxID=3155807 RepID=UPI003434BA8A
MTAPHAVSSLADRVAALVAGRVGGEDRAAAPERPSAGASGEAYRVSVTGPERRAEPTAIGRRV